MNAIIIPLDLDSVNESPQPPTERVIAYIDGFNLYFGLKDKGWRRYYWLNPRALVLSLLKPGQRLVPTKYFTARIAATTEDAAKVKRQSAFLEMVQAFDMT